MYLALKNALGKSFILFSGLLNKFSGATAAYSLRNLSNTYGGPIVKVRRAIDQDEEEFNSYEVNQIEDWVNGKQETTLPANVASSAAAYSLRKVNSSYSGDVVRIRRTSDNVEVNVGFDSDDKVSTSSPITNTTEQGGEIGSTTATTLGAFLTEGGNQDATVHTWYDQSGNAKDATQDTTGSQPKIAETGNLLDDGIGFDGTGDFLATGQSVITQSDAGSFSYFGVSTIATDEGGYFFGSAGNGSNVGSSIYAQNDSKFSLSSGFELLRDNITRSGGENLVSACYTGGRANFSVNGGGTSVTEGTFGFDANANFTIANREDGSSAATFLAGSIKEIIVYDSDQSANRFKIESNINNYYGIYTASNDGFVETWYDQSGNTNNATQPTTGDQPSIVESGNLINGLKFSGDGSTQTDFLKTDLVTTDLGTEFCLGFVGTIESTHSSTARHSVFGNTKQVGAYPNGRVAIAAVPATGSYRFTNENGAETSVIHSPAVGANTEAIVLANYDDASVKIRVNGSETTGTIISPNLNDSTVTLDIMRAKFNNSVTRQQNSPEGTVREIFVYPSNQSSTLEGIETNINNHYSTF